MWHCIAIVFLLIWVGPAGAQEVKPNIDCDAAHSAVEKMDCSDSQLASFDQVMSAAYSDALHAGKVDAAAQAEWLRRRDTDCASVDLRECLLRRVQLRIAALYSAVGAGPSFDCDKARSAAEYFICTDASLAQLDLILAGAYRHALSAGKVDRASQVSWIRRRDTECRVPERASMQQQLDSQRENDLLRCLSEQMQQRLSELQSAYGFAYGTATCRSERTVSVTFDIPPVPVMYLQAEYGSIFPDRLFTWRCDPNPQTSITLKYGFEPRQPCGMLSMWENGVKVLRQLPIAQCGYDIVPQSITLTASRLTVCYSTNEPTLKPRCDQTARTAFPTTKDPYFAPGRVPGEPETSLVQVQMGPLEGKGDPRCRLFADRLAANWDDDLADLEAKIAWRALDFPGAQPPSDVAVGLFDIDNDGQPDVVLQEDYHSHASEGERYTIFPAGSWVRDVRVVRNTKEFYAALQRDTASAGGEPGTKAHRLPNPFPSSSNDHYAVKILTISGRTIMFASPIEYQPTAKNWETSDWASSPARIFFEVQKGGTIKTMCSFAPPYRLGAQL